MKITEIITEAFDKPYAFNWSRGDHGDYDVFVKLPDGSPLNIAFNREGDDGWHVAFDRGHSQEITGEGDAQRIFATVLTSIQQFILKENPDRLYFSASKDVEPGQNPTSRSRLYERMVERYAKSMGYDVVVDDRRGHTMFVLDKDPTIAEDAVKDLEKDLKHPHSYDAIDHMMKTIAREEGITAKALHDRFVDKHDMTPDDWIKNKLSENFADGKVKGKSRPGRVKRAGASCNGSVTDLRARARKASGERAKMYHWCANMKSGRKK